MDIVEMDYTVIRTEGERTFTYRIERGRMERTKSAPLYYEATHPDATYFIYMWRISPIHPDDGDYIRKMVESDLPDLSNWITYNRYHRARQQRPTARQLSLWGDV
jgi:hypothetical protein